jgi:hypothetical protein
MQAQISIITILTLVLASCSQPTPEAPPMPKALEDNSHSYDLGSSRNYDDLVESLYAELLKNNVDLKQLEENIKALRNNKADSTLLFDKFNEKNQLYYSAADRHISTMNDSLMRDKMKMMIATNLAKYNKAIGKHTELTKMIAANNLSIEDLHTMLKIVKTLPLIEKYQNDNLPNTKSMEGFIKQQEETIKQLDTLVKK